MKHNNTRQKLYYADNSDDNKYLAGQFRSRNETPKQGSTKPTALENRGQYPSNP